MISVTGAPKFQVVIPQKIRETPDIKPGQKIQVLSYNGPIEFRPVRNTRDMRGILNGLDSSIIRDDDRA